MNSNLPGGHYGQKNASRGYRVSQVNNPARTAAFMTCTDWIAKYTGRLDWKIGESKEGYDPSGMIAFRHDGKAPVAYYDGHVGLITPADVKKFDANGGEQNVFWNGGAN